MSKDLFLFLDVDGVLNDSFWLKTRDRNPGDTETYHWNQFDPVAVERLNKLIDRFGFQVILSSTWRLDGVQNVQRWMERQGFRHRIQDATPRFNSARTYRGNEIQAWMDDYGVEPHQIVILDDDADMEHLLPRLVQTRFHHEDHPVKGLIRGGLRDEHIDQIEELLSRS